MDISCFLFHPLVDGHLGCFYFLAVMNNAAMNIHVVFFVDVCFHFSWYMPKIWIVRLCENSMFNVLRNFQPIFQNSCTILHAHQQHVSVLVSPHPHQHLFISDFLIRVLPLFFFFKTVSKFLEFWMNIKISLSISSKANWDFDGDYGTCESIWGVLPS